MLRSVKYGLSGAVLAGIVAVPVLLAATSDDLQSVEGIGSMWARHIREGLSQLAESTIADRLA